MGAMADPFLWGTATAAHQVEGGNIHNDWWRFEQEPGRIAGGDRSGAAADHWNRVAHDVGLMTALGANAYRFSVEWSRVEPTEGRWDDAAWDHYVDEVAQLRAAGVVPMATLLHFTLPAWLADRGGLLATDFPDVFARFAAEAATRLSDVRWWVTINEPNVVMVLGYVEGVFPPAVRDPRLAVRAAVAQLRGHGAASVAVRRVLPDARIGLAHHLADLQPKNPANPVDRLVTGQSAQLFNWAFQDAVTHGRIRLRTAGFPSVDVEAPELLGSTDFFGLNYYNRYLISFAPRTPAKVAWEYGDGPKTDMGYEVYPAGFERVLRAAWERYRLPVVVTENGVADNSEWVRPAALKWHVEAMRAAMAAGVPVLGYFYWSLLDNFEWAEGYAKRFGLYRVDYATQERHPTAACELFRAYATGQA
jgi:beta-glucosidase